MVSPFAEILKIWRIVNLKRMALENRSCLADRDDSGVIERVELAMLAALKPHRMSVSISS